MSLPAIASIGFLQQPNQPLLSPRPVVESKNRAIRKLSDTAVAGCAKKIFIRVEYQAARRKAAVAAGETSPQSTFLYGLCPNSYG